MTPNIASIKALSVELTMINRDAFRKDYEKILKLLDEKIDS